MSKNRHKSSPQHSKNHSTHEQNPKQNSKHNSDQHNHATTPALSILVPIYNVERYLPQCLDSLINQTFTDLEIICINDGSTDHSLDIIKDYQAKDSRIVLLDKANSGYGDSMNQGLKKAKGEYIGIVESDDFISLDAFEKLYDIARENQVDVVRANYFFNKAGQDEKNSYIEAADAGRVIDPHRHTWIYFQAPAIWSAIYRRDFLETNEITFLPTPGASYQDTGFNFKVWAAAKRAFFTTEAFLHYRIDNESSSVNNPGKVMNVCYEYEDVERYLREHQLFTELGAIMESAKFGAYYWNILRLAPKLLPKFIARTKSEFQVADQEGTLIETYFVSPTQWNLLQYILKHSVTRAILYIRFLKIGQKFKALAKKLWLKTHPSYRKQKQISDLITELYAESDRMAAKIKSLITKKDSKND